MDWALLFLFTLLAYFVKAITGFGDALVMSSLFSFVVPNSVTSPVSLLLSFPANLIMAFKERKNLSLKIIVPFSLFMFIGILPGTFLLTHMPNRIIKSILGIVIIAVAVNMMFSDSKAKKVKQNPLLSLIAGIISGLLCGLFGIGALLAAYMSRSADNRYLYRGNLCCIFLVENIFRIIVYAAAGIFNGHIFLTTAVIIPAALLGLFNGMKTDKKLKNETVKKAVLCLLIASGAVLLVNNAIFY